MKHYVGLSWVYSHASNQARSNYNERAVLYAKHKKLKIIGNTDGSIISLMKYICLDVEFLLLDHYIYMSVSDQKLLAGFCKRKQIHIIIV